MSNRPTSYGFESGVMVRARSFDGLGEVVNDVMTSEEAIERAGLNWEVSKEHLYLDNGARVPNAFALVRNTDQKVMGTCGPEYVPVQNRDAFSFVDQLVGEGVRYEVAGAVKGGANVFLVAKLPEDVRIAGDEFKRYMTLFTGHDGSMGLSVCPTNYRLKCWNATPNFGQGERKITVRHVGNVNARIDAAMEFLRLASTSTKALTRQAESLLRVPMTEVRYQGLVEALLPFPSDGNDQAQRNALERRAQLWRAIEADDLENIRGTGWGAIQAVADYAQHYSLRPLNQSQRENRFLETTAGNAIVDRAREMVLALG